MGIIFKRHLSHWVAIFAVLLSSLAPSVSQAVSFDHADLSIEVCSATGVKMTHVIDLEDTDGLTQTNVHCPLCVVHDNYIIPLNHELSFAKPVDNNIYPQLFYQSPKPLFSWLALPSRAPPTVI